MSNQMPKSQLNRRNFLWSSIALPIVSAGAGSATLGLAKSKSTSPAYKSSSENALKDSGRWKFPLSKEEMDKRDDVIIAQGFKAEVLISRGDKINAAGDEFGDCCDYTAFLPSGLENQAFLWVNHEYIDLHALYGKNVSARDKTREQCDTERKLVGGSYLELERMNKSSPWKVKQNSTAAFRISHHTKIPLVGPAGGAEATGTMGNCSGGITPWGTILTCEENVEDYYSEGNWYGWNRFENIPPEHYGYVVEVDPKSKSARKLTGLGRFAHEGAYVHIAEDKHVVVYMGDDARGQCLYKFVSKGKVSGDAQKDKDLLVEGSLYVADLGKQKWVLLDASSDSLKNSKDPKFLSAKDVCRETRVAAKLSGGTPLNRPEGIAVNAQTGVVYICLTNNDKAGDYHGSILAVEELEGHSGTSFKSHTFATGGTEFGVSCPDNIVSGPGNYLWVGMDISAGKLGKGIYKAFTRNGLFRLETVELGSVSKLAARCLLLAPPGAEVTGPCFTPDGDTAFVSIQHPGEESLDESGNFSSNWPKGKKNAPLSSVIQVRPTQQNAFSKQA